MMMMMVVVMMMMMIVLVVVVVIIIQFFIIYVPSQQPQGQLQTQHNVEKNNYFMNKHNIKSKTS
jgi:uncharacterized membrane protein YqiK